jgi:hypothetical protein
MATGRVPTTANSPLTAKGDLFTYSTAPARLAVGNSGETIVADSSTSTGLRYQGNFAAGKNKIINGDFGIWQRGTSITIPSGYGYTADRWRTYSYASNSSTVSRQTFTPGAAPVAGYEGQYFARVNSTSTDTVIEQLIEDVRTFAGQTVTVSFWAKAASNLTISNTPFQSFGSGGSGDVYVTNQTVSVTTSWQRFALTYSIPSVAGKTIGTGSCLGISFGTAGTVNVNLDLWGVQVEAGSVATAFQTATGTIQGELSAAQRYYYRASFATNESLGTVNFASATLAQMVLTMPVQMRSDPAFAAGATNIIAIYTNAFFGSSNITLDAVSNRTVSLNVTVSGGTIGQAGIAYLNLNANNFLEFSSEL